VPVALVLLSGVIRVGAAWQTLAIFNDGPSFLRVAAFFYEGHYAVALGHSYHPLYPLLISLLAPWVGDFADAGVVVSVAAGSLAVLGLYAFLARAFDPRVAALGGVLFALHPYAATFSADVQSEGLYFALFLGALAYTWRAIQEAGPRPAALGGLMAGAAYLVRPEGLGVAVSGAVVAALLLFQGRWTVPVFIRFAAALAVGVAVVAGPYVVHLRYQTGEWMLTQKKSISDLVTPPGSSPGEVPPGVPDRLRFRPPALDRPGALHPPQALHRPRALHPPRALQASILPARIDFEPRSLSALLDLAAVAGGALHPVVLLLVLVGIASVRGPPGDRGRFLIVLIVLYGVVFYGLALNVGYLQRRHVLAPLLPLLGYAALGLPVLGRLVLRALPPRFRASDERVGIWLVIGLIAIITLPKTWAPHREERLAARRAAEWLAAREGLSGAVAAAKHRTAWYAGEAFVHLGRAGGGDRVEALSDAGASFLIVDDVLLAGRPALKAEIATLPELHRVEAAGRTAFVYSLPGDRSHP
jgi:hypothetical protein